MLAAVLRRNERRNRVEAPKVKGVVARRWDGFDAEHEWVNVGGPDWPGVRCSLVGGLESMKSPALRRRRTTAWPTGCAGFALCGRPIGWISPEPFPGKE